ncbi:prostate androgen-regulated mucin-like protein 1 isoform X1 [Mirounga angustirostris]|uniref:prostate androgen-regulated mucin-like protein 1 isoform X1 n=1 Tax=Mirounga angustirostris TaxID=9716 RepID=UPI001E68CE00|nr:prostate androgen-regulated mucin-like protein 1 isoform X2 [Mirounga angustirostris]
MQPYKGQPTVDKAPVERAAECADTGLRVQSLPPSAPLPGSLPAASVPSTAIWTSSPQSPPASPTSGTPSNSVFPATASAPAPLLPKNISTEPREEETTSGPASHREGTSTDPSPAGGGVHSTATPPEHSSSTPEEASTPPTGSQHPSAAPTESPTLTSPQAPASSPPPLSTSPPEVSSASSASTNHSSAETSTKPTGAPTPPEAPAEEHSSAHTPTSHATAQPLPAETTPQATVPTKVTCVMMDMETTASPGVSMQEVEHALSSGSIAAITVTVIAVVLLVFGVAAYLKIRHSSYGRLLDDHDYGSWGNYNNPLYDDS